MKIIFILLSLPLLNMHNGCHHRAKAESVPNCIQKMIEASKTGSNGPTQIDEYLYNDNPVYLVIAGCCDQYNMLYDQHCNVICAPSGGFTGRGDQKCPDFNSTAKFIKKIWPIDKK